MVLEDKQAVPKIYSRFLMCPITGIFILNRNSNTFSFNSPFGSVLTAMDWERLLKRTLIK